jgi:heterodisulfide reductase subunit A
LRGLLGQVVENDRIELLTNTRLVKTEGFIGNFSTVVETDGKQRRLEHGVTIVATGARERRGPEYQLDQAPGVITQLDLEQKISDVPAELQQAKSIVMIQCVGVERDGANRCSRICCNVAIKNALKLKELNPNANVYILFKDIRSYGFYEQLYTNARERGVIFLRYEENTKPTVELSNGKLIVTARDQALGEDLALSADFVVLSEPMIPSEGHEELSIALKVPLTREGFYLEAHPKLRPVDFSSEGVFVCGAAHYPKHISESIAQALATAARAGAVLGHKTLEVGGAVAEVNPDKCAACLTCVRVCPYHVPRINEKGVAEINVAACQGCGTCAGECPGKAITLLNYSDEQVESKPKALLTGV